MDLRACLDQCSVGLLRQIAAAHGVALSEPPARAEIARALVERLLAPGYLAGYISSRSEAEQRVLALVANQGGQVRGFLLERLVGESDGGRGEASRETLGGLVQVGLLYRSFVAIGPDRGEVYVLPSELEPLLPRVELGRSNSIAAAAAPREIRRCSPAFNILALASFVRRWRLGSARSARREGQLAALGAEAAELTLELPGRTPRERWTLLAHLALRLGLFVREEAGLQPTEQLPEWLGRGERGERELWSNYLNAEQWNDLARAGSGGERFAGRTSDPVAARAQVLAVIRSLPSDAWLLLDDVERLVRERVPDFLREGFEVATSRLVDLQSGEVLGGAESWERVERPLVRYILAGPLFWLGVLEWGHGEAEWDRLRITELGRAWLDGVENVLAPAAVPMELTERRTLIAHEHSDLRLLWNLEPYFKLERRGPPSEYSLNRGTVGRGLQGGGSLDDLRRQLEQGAGRALPSSFAEPLSRWAAQAGRYRLTPAVVLTTATEEDLDRVLAQPEAVRLVRERLGPRAAAVLPARAVDLAEQLERLGHLPQVDSALRLMAGRRAYGAMVDEHTLEALLFCIRLMKVLSPALADEIPHADILAQRIEQALGPIGGPRTSRRARSIARKLKKELPGIADDSDRVL